MTTPRKKAKRKKPDAFERSIAEWKEINSALARVETLSMAVYYKGAIFGLEMALSEYRKFKRGKR